jgi:hypothetical protein
VVLRVGHCLFTTPAGAICAGLVGLLPQGPALVFQMDSTLQAECLSWTLVGPLMRLRSVHQLWFCVFNIAVYGTSIALQNLEPDPTAAQLAEHYRLTCGLGRETGTHTSWVVIGMVYCLLTAHACERAERRVHHLRLVAKSR